MSITLALTKEQLAWLPARVAAGEFPSVEAAAERAIAERMALDPAQIDADDPTWAKPLVDEGLAQIDRGDILTLEEHLVRTRERFKALGACWRQLPFPLFESSDMVAVARILHGKRDITRRMLQGAQS